MIGGQSGVSRTLSAAEKVEARSIIDQLNQTLDINGDRHIPIDNDIMCLALNNELGRAVVSIGQLNSARDIKNGRIQCTKKNINTVLYGSQEDVTALALSSTATCSYNKVVMGAIIVGVLALAYKMLPSILDKIQGRSV